MNKVDTRRSKILKILDENGQIYVNSLSEEMGVSNVTIRNDLCELEKRKLLVRAQGGAFKTSLLPLTITERRKISFKEKRLIGEKALALIEEDDSIILDSGTTTLEIAHGLESFERLTVISNAVNIINHLSKAKNLELLVPGGYVKDFSLSMVGPMAERNFKQLLCRKLFLGIDGVIANTGIYTHHMEEARLNQIMIEIAEKVIVVADSSKFGKSGLAFIQDLSKIDTFITDTNISSESVAMLKKNSVEVLIAD